ncbi:MAG TPA: DUF4410 domain-containing protein, partial [Thermoanaerobaculia bacterium]|nr:DUF4410 domain-containing protein [Thermoanaerobaculia bacterium]
DYDRIVILPFDTSSTPLPDAKDRSYDTIKSVLDSYTDSFTEALRSELKAKAKVEQASSTPHTAHTLVIRGTVESMSPGSRAKRYLVGYGAGAAGSKIHGEIVDANSGDVLLRFTQERRSGGTWKVAGGNDAQVMRDSVHAEAQDVAHMLDEF